MLPKLGGRVMSDNHLNPTRPKGFMNPTLVTTRVLMLLLAAMLTSGCFNRDRQPIYVDSEEVHAIEAPEGLSQPRTRTTFQIPGYSLPQLAGSGEQRPPRVLPSAEAEASRSHIRFGPTGLHLEVRDEPESVWRRLSFSLNRGGMSVRQVDEPNRRYHFHFDHEPIRIARTGMSRLAFWRGSDFDDFSGNYRVEVQPDGDQTRVILLDGNGDVVEMNRGEFVLAMLRERLG